MQILLVIMSTLAVWRVAHMLQGESGPAGIFLRLQAWVGKLNDKPGSFADGFFCFYCFSIWLSFLPALLLQWGNFWYILIYWFAISAGAIFINLLHSKLEQ